MFVDAVVRVDLARGHSTKVVIGVFQGRVRKLGVGDRTELPVAGSTTVDCLVGVRPGASVVGPL